ncbi:hypothetical protein EDD85DRAFT_818484 [Armillaria nabsnona]|nr:hypothetical protein EDD85DRAFT_818484 [Armillaria nabsnona]
MPLCNCFFLLKVILPGVRSAGEGGGDLCHRKLPKERFLYQIPGFPSPPSQESSIFGTTECQNYNSTIMCRFCLDNELYAAKRCKAVDRVPPTAS